MTAVTQSEFAKRMGFAKSYVTALKHAGRLVMTPDGKLVEVEASQARIAATADPQRDDVAARHAQRREAPQTEPANDKIGSSYQAARAVKEKYAALNAKLEYEKASGDLIPKADVDFVLNDYGATLRSMMETMADRLAPIIHPLQTMEETHAALSEAAEDVLREMSETMRHRAEKRESNHV